MADKKFLVTRKGAEIALESLGELQRGGVVELDSNGKAVYGPPDEDLGTEASFIGRVKISENPPIRGIKQYFLSKVSIGLTRLITSSDGLLLATNKNKDNLVYRTFDGILNSYGVAE